MFRIDVLRCNRSSLWTYQGSCQKMGKKRSRRQKIALFFFPFMEQVANFIYRTACFFPDALCIPPAHGGGSLFSNMARMSAMALPTSDSSCASPHQQAHTPPFLRQRAVSVFTSARSLRAFSVSASAPVRSWLFSGVGTDKITPCGHGMRAVGGRLGRTRF